jgi:hypothetical protein
LGADAEGRDTRWIEVRKLEFNSQAELMKYLAHRPKVL